jgi:dsDNA-specific endonuclease/ATPase MutS2
MTHSDFNIIQQNVPEASIELIQQYYKKNNNDIMQTICALLNITKAVKQKSEWEERRQICDDHDAEMQKILKQMRQTDLQSKDGTLNVPITIPSYESPLKKPKVETLSPSTQTIGTKLPKIYLNPNL